MPHFAKATRDTLRVKHQRSFVYEVAVPPVAPILIGAKGVDAEC